jgi:hypothetical protein
MYSCGPKYGRVLACFNDGATATLTGQRPGVQQTTRGRIGGTGNSETTSSATGGQLPLFEMKTVR